MKSKRKSCSRKPRKNRGKSNRTLRKKNRTKRNRKYRKIKGGGLKGTFRCIKCMNPISLRGGDIYYTSDRYVGKDGHTGLKEDRPMCANCARDIVNAYHAEFPHDGVMASYNALAFEGWKEKEVEFSTAEKKANRVRAIAEWKAAEVELADPELHWRRRFELELLEPAARAAEQQIKEEEAKEREKAEKAGGAAAAE